MSKNSYKNQPTVLETLFLGIFKVFWALIKFIFRGFKFGSSKTGISLQEKNYIVAKRLELEKLLQSSNPIELKHVLFEADKLVDLVLRSGCYDGQNFADRLRCAEKSIPHSVYNELWEGHKVRNQIAHEQIDVSNAELREAAMKLLKYLRSL